MLFHFKSDTTTEEARKMIDEVYGDSSIGCSGKVNLIWMTKPSIPIILKCRLKSAFGL